MKNYIFCLLSNNNNPPALHIVLVVPTFHKVALK